MLSVVCQLTLLLINNCNKSALDCFDLVWAHQQLALSVGGFQFLVHSSSNQATERLLGITVVSSQVRSVSAGISQMAGKAKQPNNRDLKALLTPQSPEPHAVFANVKNICSYIFLDRKLLWR